MTGIGTPDTYIQEDTKWTSMQLAYMLHYLITFRITWQILCKITNAIFSSLLYFTKKNRFFYSCTCSCPLRWTGCLLLLSSLDLDLNFLQIAKESKQRAWAWPTKWKNKRQRMDKCKGHRAYKAHWVKEVFCKFHLSLTSSGVLVKKRNKRKYI